MNARSRAVVCHLFGWCIIVFFVVLLTVIFSFLGTLICAALAGMMMGSARLSRWYSLLVSLIFPGVVSTVLRISGSELPERQVLMLSLLCFGVFWVICLVMYALVAEEKTSKALPKPSPEVEAPEPVKSAPASELTLESLEGMWLPKSGQLDVSHCQKVLEIQNGTAVLSTFNAEGNVDSRARATLALNRAVGESRISIRSRADMIPEFVI